jgi:hypothetical protein
MIPSESNRLARASHALILVLALATWSCAGGSDTDSETEAARPPTPEPAWTHHPDDLTRAAVNIIGFLRDSIAFREISVADTVTLYLTPEGGGDRVSIPREQLSDRTNWRIASADGRTTYSLVPPPGNTELTTRVGRHLNCLEYPLSSRHVDLPDLPHVGTMLTPPGQRSCLQSWNVTLVFDTEEGPPRLRAAVYDQWEW